MSGARAHSAHLQAPAAAAPLRHTRNHTHTHTQIHANTQTHGPVFQLICSALPRQPLSTGSALTMVMVRAHRSAFPRMSATYYYSFKCLADGRHRRRRHHTAKRMRGSKRSVLSKHFTLQIRRADASGIKRLLLLLLLMLRVLSRMNVCVCAHVEDPLACKRRLPTPYRERN